MKPTAKAIFINVYEQTQYYGGAEEGGWFYWGGVPIWTAVGICLCSDDSSVHSDTCPITGFLSDAQAVVKAGREGYLDSFISGDSEVPEYRHEAVYGKGRSMFEERQPGRAYPEVRPYYE